MNLLADTEVLIDKLACRAPYVDDVRRLCAAAYFGDISLWATVQSYLDALHALQGHVSSQELREACVACTEFFVPCGLRGTDFVFALQSDWEDMENCVVARSAENMAADYILVHDACAFNLSRVKTITCAEALELLKDRGACYDDIAI